MYVERSSKKSSFLKPEKLAAGHKELAGHCSLPAEAVGSEIGWRCWVGSAIIDWTWAAEKCLPLGSVH